MKTRFYTVATLAFLFFTGCDSVNPSDPEAEPDSQMLSIVDDAGDLRGTIEFSEGVTLPASIRSEKGRYVYVVTNEMLAQSQEASVELASKADGIVSGDYCVTAESEEFTFCDEILARTDEGSVDASGRWNSRTVMHGSATPEYEGDAGCLNTFPQDFVVVTTPLDGTVTQMRFYYPDNTVGRATLYGLNGGCETNLELLETLASTLKAFSGFASQLDEGGKVRIKR